MKRAALITLFCLTFCFGAFAQPIVTTHQGMLKVGTPPQPANGNYDFIFTIFDAPTAGVGTSQVELNVPVTDGVYTVRFPISLSIFEHGQERWLEIQVRPSGTSTWTPLQPRQYISSTPYAIRSHFAVKSLYLGDFTSDNFVQNTTTQQPSSNFNVSGNGTAGGTLSGNLVNATTQYNINGERILSNPGFENVFVGRAAGASNSGGLENAFFGARAGNSNTTGGGNSFFGFIAGLNTTTGVNNSIFGSRAGSDIGTGNFNSLFGHRAGENVDGSLNSFFGTGSGLFTNAGSSNTFIGHDAGNTNSSGSFNTVVGENADVGSSGLTNATAIGSKALVTQSNSVVVGSIGGTNGAFFDTTVGIGTTAPSFKLHVIDSQNTGLRVQNNTAGGTVASFGAAGAFHIDSSSVSGGRLMLLENGNLGLGVSPATRLDVAGIVTVRSLGGGGTASLCWNASTFQISACSSSSRYKSAVRSFSRGLDIIRELRPVSFNWIDGGMRDMGLFAEDVARVEPLLVTHNDKGVVEGVKYDRVGVVLINAVKEQQKQLEAQKDRIDEQDKVIIALRAQVDALTNIVCAINPAVDVCKEK